MKQKTAGRSVWPSTAFYWVEMPGMGSLVHPFQVGELVFDAKFQLLQRVDCGFIGVRTPLFISDLGVQIGVL